MRYFDKPYLQIDYDYSLSCTVNTWRGYLTYEEYQEAMKKCKEVVLYTGATTIITNLCHLATSTHAETFEWTSLAWLTGSEVNEVRKMAIIVDTLALAPVEQIETINQLEDCFLMSRYFTSVEEAKKWIAEDNFK